MTGSEVDGNSVLNPASASPPADVEVAAATDVVTLALSFFLRSSTFGGDDREERNRLRDPLSEFSLFCTLHLASLFLRSSSSAISFSRAVAVSLPQLSARDTSLFFFSAA